MRTWWPQVVLEALSVSLRLKQWSLLQNKMMIMEVVRVLGINRFEDRRQMLGPVDGLPTLDI